MGVATGYYPVSYENRDPPNWGPRVPIFIEKWGPGSLFS